MGAGRRPASAWSCTLQCELSVRLLTSVTRLGVINSVIDTLAGGSVSDVPIPGRRELVCV